MKPILLIALTGILFLAGCGPKKYINGATSSLASETLNETKAISYCSQDMSANADLRFKLMTYTKGSAEDQKRYQHLKFTSFPTSFSTDETSGIEIYVWYVSSSGEVEQRVQVPFGLERIQGGGTFTTLETPRRMTLYFKDVKNAGAASMEQYLSARGLLIDTLDTDGNAKVLTVSLIRGTDTKAITHKASALIPSFYSNPADYAVNRPTVLQDLHPLKAYKDQSWSKAQYDAKAAEMCF